MNCLRCGGLGWVCENHPASPWNKDAPDGCECGAGMPCEDCNQDEPPRMPPGITVLYGATE